MYGYKMGGKHVFNHYTGNKTRKIIYGKPNALKWCQEHEENF